MLAPQPSSGAPNCISGRSPAICGSTAGVRHLECMPPADDHMSLVAIQYERGALRLLEQRKLPLETVWLEIAGCEDCFTAIRDMTVRGAPAIAIAAALALAVELVNAQRSGAAFASTAEAVDYIVGRLDYLVTSRPTAVNLSEAAQRLSKLARQAAAAPAATGEAVALAVVEAAERMLAEDVAANKAMGRYGADALFAAAQARGRGSTGKLRVLTHCNTGSLATAAFGTALGVVRTLHETGQLEHAYCTETRPYNQGARLTAYELVHDGLPATLLCDSAAAALMAAGRIDAVVVGADRIAANGDTANKIGTFSLAVAAQHHGIPFFIAAPTTTVDPELPDGSGIPIEQRSPEEVTHFRGQRVAAEIDVWNPSFDVTPAALIEGIITEHGMVPRAAAQGGTAASSRGPFQAREFLRGLGLLIHDNGKEAPAPKLATVPGFVALTVTTVKEYVAARPQLAEHVGPPSTAAEWTVREVGDGNINFVYIVEGPAGGVCIKQALPYVRICGESWPLAQERVRFEAAALMVEGRYCPEHVPAVYHYDEAMALIAMQYLAPPHVILRHGLIQGDIYPLAPAHIARFLAATLFKSSLLAVDTERLRAGISRFQNVDMCRLTERVIFEDPYYPCPDNHHTSPQLDADAQALYSDTEAKLAISKLKAKFCEQAQALVHGDLHTGSLMVTQETTFAIDPEFGYYGPMAFDVGKIIANFLLMFLAVDGHSTEASPRSEQRRWLMDSAAAIWERFAEEFLRLWSAHEARGDAYPPSLFGPAAAAGPTSLKAAQREFMAQLWRDSVGFMGAVMIRRIVGIAHVAEMKTIADPDVRATCERRALRLGRRLLVEGGSFESIQQVAKAAEAARHDGAAPCYPL